MGTIDPGLAITVVGVMLTLMMGPTSLYNGRKAREMIDKTTKSTQELIKEETRLTREILDRIDKKLDRMDEKLDAIHDTLRLVQRSSEALNSPKLK